jgi:hypothetical protein
VYRTQNKALKYLPLFAIVLSQKLPVKEEE